MLKRKSLAYSLLLLLATAAVYGQFLKNPVLFDDLPFLSALLQPHTELSDVTPWRIRWLPYFTLVTAASGLDSSSIIPIRIVSLLLHAGVGIALFLFLKKLFHLVLASKGESGESISLDSVACFAALLFVLHPAAVYGAAYLVQRTIVMATLFSMLALLAYLQGLEVNSRKWLWASVALYFMAVMSKEHAIMLPAVMLALTVLLAIPVSPAIRRLWPIYAACMVIAVFVLSQKMGILGSVYEPRGDVMLESVQVEHPYAMSIMTQAWLYFKYLALWLIPNPAWMSADMREPFAENFWSGYALAAFTFITYGLVALWLLRKRGKIGLAGFAMLFPWLLFMTEFSTVRIQESFVLYRSYLWMPGVFVLLPLCITRLKAKAAFWGMLAIVIMLSLMSVDRLGTFSHSLLLWDDAESLVRDRRNLPGVDRIYGNRAKYFLEVKRFHQAAEDYQIAIGLNPGEERHHHGLASTYFVMEEYEKAIAEFTKGIELGPPRSSAWHGRGLAFRAQGKNELALEDFQHACKLGWKQACKDFSKLQVQLHTSKYTP